MAAMEINTQKTIQPEIDYLHHIFKVDFGTGAVLPSLLYITKQEFGGKKRDRTMHSHDSLCEILLVYRGAGYYILNNQSYPIQAGDILFYNQNEAHEVRSMSDIEIGTFCFGLTNLHLPELPVNHFIADNSPPVRPSGDHFDFLFQLCEQAYQMLDQDVFSKATAQVLASAFVMLACKLEETLYTCDIATQDTQMAKRIREYLDQHFTEAVTLKDIANEFQCSEPYISHVFKKVMGYPPIQYVIRRRIGLAQTHLICSDYTATQIATLVGYDNTNYFNTLFTKIVGISPMRYKKQYLETLRVNITQ